MDRRHGHSAWSILVILAIFAGLAAPSHDCPAGCKCAYKKQDLASSSGVSISVQCNLRDMYEKSGGDDRITSCSQPWDSLTVVINEKSWPPASRTYGWRCVAKLKQLTIKSPPGDADWPPNDVQLKHKDVLEGLLVGRKQNRLDSFTLENTHFTSIKGGLFDQLNSLDLQRISIKGNKRLQDLDTGLFFRLRKLITLDLSGNALHKVELAKWSLNDAQKLAEINLSYNQISEVGLNAFNRTPNLRSLQLQNNQLQSIHADRFKPLAMLAKLDLSANRLNLFEGDLLDFPSLERLNLAGNPLDEHQLHWFEHACPEHLQELDLQSTQLKSTGNLNLGLCPSLQLVHFGRSRMLDCVNASRWPESIEFRPSSLKRCPDEVANAQVVSNTRVLPQGPEEDESRTVDSRPLSSIFVLAAVVSTLLVLMISFLVAVVTCLRRSHHWHMSRSKSMRSRGTLNAHQHQLQQQHHQVNNQLGSFVHVTPIGGYMSFDPHQEAGSNLLYSSTSGAADYLLTGSHASKLMEDRGDKDTESSGYGNDSGISQSDKNEQVMPSTPGPILMASMFSTRDKYAHATQDTGGGAALSLYKSGIGNEGDCSPKKAYSLRRPQFNGQLSYSSTSLNNHNSGGSATRLISPTPYAKASQMRTPVVYRRPANPSLVFQQPMLYHHHDPLFLPLLTNNMAVSATAPSTAPIMVSSSGLPSPHAHLLNKTGSPLSMLDGHHGMEKPLFVNSHQHEF